MLDDGDRFTRSKDVVDSRADPVVVELFLVLYFLAPLGKSFFLSNTPFFIEV